MKGTTLTYVVLFLGWIMGSPLLKGQGPVAPLLPERVTVCTDRTLYVAGESVRFSARMFSGRDRFSDDLGRVLYCELVTPAGTRISGGKYLLEDGSAKGCLSIPEETLSGVYYLKCYTRFMRNGPADTYAYVLIRIVNPVRPDVLAGEIIPERCDTAGSTGKMRSLPAPPVILPAKESYAPGEEVRITVKKGSGPDTRSQLVLSVIPDGTSDDLFTTWKVIPDTVGNGSYLPETRGISLSGQLVAKETGKPLPGARVNLSVIGDKNIQAVPADSAGRFWFTMPDLTGQRDLFLCADNAPGITPELLIDNDFCSRPVSLSAFAFLLSDEERKAALKLAVNTRLSSAFGTDASSGTSPEAAFDEAFYGQPSDVLVIDKYIDLPTLEDYFNELPVIVRVKKVKGQKQIRFFNSLDEMSNYAPLVLVDWVAVNDEQKILSIPPSEIDRIELVNAVYVKGRITYGGIISIVSKRNDFAGIDLPASGLFLSYRFLEPCAGDLQADSLPAGIPDARNTVVWNPTVETNAKGTAELSFTAPRTPGRYVVLLREILADGIGVARRGILVDNSTH